MQTRHDIFSVHRRSGFAKAQNLHSLGDRSSTIIILFILRSAHRRSIPPCRVIPAWLHSTYICQHNHYVVLSLFLTIECKVRTPCFRLLELCIIGLCAFTSRTAPGKSTVKQTVKTLSLQLLPGFTFKPPKS